MIKLVSKLEDNIIDGILIKKGVNILTPDIQRRLGKSKVFQTFCANKYFEIICASAPAQTSEKVRTFNDMSYAELKQFVIDKGIKTVSMKKADILAALNK